ncbi:multicomponent Na+:H+ antiporter subunit A [Lipingzhangella halophila]|uniref:Multicomponent Na+:H+ antiporter subunit A n=1 Tax=Lipingzhangella halophila TaxID=1783352 RepID=A0A7W7RCG2_9ACTN|nr:hydrogen gas-evolving membrane-bound hydrogenase subunit E [Lipingzhangella halophila]MBB4929447.1 multicomponent Na+:H+ antiporter subunit A [Lipingzhangella halophila]
MILVLVLAALVVTAALAPFLERWLGRDAGWPLAAVFLVLAGFVAAAGSGVVHHRPVIVQWSWLPSLDAVFALRLDGLSLLFALLILGVGALIMAYCTRYFGHGAHAGVYLLLTLFAASMLGLVLADDLVLLFLFWELTSVCSFFLIGNAGLAAAAPARRALLVTVLGGLGLLAVVVLVAVTAGTSQISVILREIDWAGNPGFTALVALLLVVAGFTKSAQVPFHFWLPDAMAASTPVSAYLHAATMVKAGVYLFMRFSPAFAGELVWTVPLVGVGLLTAIVGAFLALKQHDLKALLAYSTVSQLGFLTALVGIGTPEALGAAALHTIAHALFKATLFMLVGIIDREAGSRDVRKLGGMWRVMPVTATLMGLAAMSLAGIPPALGFVSKEKIYAAFIGFHGPEWVGWALAGLAVGAAVLTFAYGVRLLYGAFGGPTVQRRLTEPSWPFRIPAAITALLGIALGIAVSTLTPLVEQVVLDTRLVQGDPHLELWPGLSPELLMSALTIAIGLSLFWARGPVDRWLQRRRLPFSGVSVFEWCHGALVRIGSGVGAPSRGLSPIVQVPPILLSLLVLGAAGLWWGVPLAQRLPGSSQPEDWTVVAVLAAAVLAIAVTSSRVGAIGLLGVIGFVVAVWFLMLGAPDLAMTQMLIEFLTVAVAVLALSRLPARFHPSGWLRAGVSAGVALAAGAAATALALAFTGRRGPSEIRDYYLGASKEETGGTNVVNTILVDFRALDTLGEVTVLVAVAIGIAALAQSTPLLPGRLRSTKLPRSSPIENRADNAIVLTIFGRILAPVIVVLSLYLLFRGHNAPGGGFIAALVAGAGLALAYVSAPHPDHASRNWPSVGLVGAGLAIAVADGALGLAGGSFLHPFHGEVEVLGVTLKGSTSLIFDVGVYLIVVGLVVTALRRLGHGLSADLARGGPSTPYGEESGNSAGPGVPEYGDAGYEDAGRASEEANRNGGTQ